jgi:hypothetical protein
MGLNLLVTLNKISGLPKRRGLELLRDLMSMTWLEQLRYA